MCIRDRPVESMETSSSGELDIWILLTQVCFDYDRILLNEPGRPLRDLPPLVQHDDRVTDLHDQSHVVLNDDKRYAHIPDPKKRISQLGCLRVVQAGRRLIQ